MVRASLGKVQMIERVRIADVFLGKADRPYVIAEIGVNHNGDMALARQTIDAAVEAGADCVKFQAFDADEFMGDKDVEYEYETAEGVVRESMYSMFKRLELSAEGHAELMNYAAEKGVEYLASAADPSAADMLMALDVPAMKIASEDLINEPLLHYIGQLRAPVLLSTGMGDTDEVDRAMTILREEGCEQILLLHCVSLYPTPEGDANILRIKGLQERYGLPVGYSDHTLGTSASIGAVALGVMLVEKHFTLDRNLPGPDHKLSADPQELTALVRETSSLYRQLGEADVKPAKGEHAARLEFRRSIVAARPIKAGETLGSDMIALRRPGTGLHPRHSVDVVGRTVSRNLLENEQINLEDLA